MPIRRNDSLIGDADLQALLDKFIEGTSVDEKGTLHFLHLDDDELYRILPDAFLADPALPDRQVRDLLRRALWDTRKAGDVTIETLTTRAKLAARDLMARPLQPFAMWMKFRARSMGAEEGFRVRWNDVTIESRDHLPAYMTLDDYHLNGHGRIAPREPVFYGHLIARCRARDEEAAASRMLDAFEIFMAVFNLYDGFGRRSIGSDIRKDGKLWNGPYQFLFNGRRFIGRETVWYEPEFREDDWTSFPPTMREVLRVIPRVRKALRALEASPLRLTLTGVLRLLQDAMVARDPRYKLLRYWSALEQLYSEPQSREKKYGLIINRATSMDHNKPLARWKLSHISRLRNAYVHAGGGDNELQVMSEHLRLMLSRHVNFLLFHAATISDHNHWLALSDLPDKEDALLSRRALLDQRIGLVQARDAAWAKAVAKPGNK